MKVLHRVGAVAAGMVAAVLVVTVMDSLSSAIWPLPEGLDPLDPANMEQIREFVSSLPATAFLWHAASWTLAMAVGVFTARRIAPGRAMIPGLVVAGLFLAATIANYFSLPHPIWLGPVALLGCLAGALAGLLLAAPDAHRVAVQREIAAPVGAVFQVISTPDGFCEAVPEIEQVEILPGEPHGVGCRFRETRRVPGGSTATHEMVITEFEPDAKVRIVSDAGGATWDTVFRVESTGDRETRLTMEMDARPHKLSAKLIVPLILGGVSKAVAGDMDSVKRLCEERAGQTADPSKTA